MFSFNGSQETSLTVKSQNELCPFATQTRHSVRRISLDAAHVSPTIYHLQRLKSQYHVEHNLSKSRTLCTF